MADTRSEVGKNAIGTVLRVISKSNLVYIGELQEISTEHSHFVLKNVTSMEKDQEGKLIFRAKYLEIKFKGTEVSDIEAINKSDDLISQDPAVISVKKQYRKKRSPMPRQSGAQSRQMSRVYQPPPPGTRPFAIQQFRGMPPMRQTVAYHRHPNQRFSKSEYLEPVFPMQRNSFYDFVPSYRNVNNQRGRRSNFTNRRKDSNKPNPAPRKSRSGNERFDKDYNFEENNAELEKVMKNLTVVDVPDKPIEVTEKNDLDAKVVLADGQDNVQIAYEKDQFFDSLSRPTVTNNVGRRGSNANFVESKLNRETFGQSGIRRYSGLGNRFAMQGRRNMIPVYN